MSYQINDLSQVDDPRGLPDDPFYWQFFDFAPYDGACCGPKCSQGRTGCLYGWREYVVLACSGQCVADYVAFLRQRMDFREVQMNAAYTAIPVGELGSYQVIKVKQERMF